MPESGDHLRGGAEDRAAGEAPEPTDDQVREASAELLPGVLRHELLFELQEAIARGRRELEGDEVLGMPAEAAETARALAEAADAIDRVRARADADLAAGISPELAVRAANLLGRIGTMLQLVTTVRGRFAPEDASEPDLEAGPWEAHRVLPAGYEDLDPGELTRVAAQLSAAAGGEPVIEQLRQAGVLDSSSS